MTTSNGHAPTADKLKEQIRLLRLQAKHAEAKVELSLLEQASIGGLGFGWGDIADPFSARNQDGFGQMWLPLGAGTLFGKQDGRMRPFFWHDFDLDRIRSLARWLATRNDQAVGLLECITDYTVKTGFEYESVPGKRLLEDATAKELAAQVQEVIEEFRSLNVLGETVDETITWADRERSCVLRSVRDGEAVIRTFDQGDGTTIARHVEPEQIRQPAGTDSNCAFGVETDPRDVEKVLAYHITYDGGTEYDRVPADEIAHLKANTDSCVKRGLSDFYPVADALNNVNKLVRNMSVSAGIQSAIAWIEQLEQTTSEGAARLIGTMKDLNRPEFTHPWSGRNIKTQHHEPGTKLIVGKGKTYIPAPLAGNTTNHIATIQACLRAIGSRWKMPEYFTGDGSNANMASTLVAGAPFVVRVECRQAIYGRFFLRVLWMAVRNAARAGRFLVNGRRFDWREVSRYVDIVPTPPQVSIADQGVQASVDHQDIAAGVMSLQTRRARRGLDDEQERRNLKEEPPTRVGGKVTDVDAEGDPRSPEQAQAGGGVPQDADSDTLASLFGESATSNGWKSIREGCVPNQHGPGHHDDKTGHPCSDAGSGSAASVDREANKLIRQATGGTGTTQKRAAAGGEEGPNGEWYSGGAFIATTDMPKQVRQKVEKLGKARGVETEPGVRAILDPGVMSIYDKLGPGWLFSPREMDFARYAQPWQQLSETEQQGYEELLAKYKSGERTVKVTERPDLAGPTDAARMVVAKMAVPGAILDRLSPDIQKHLARYSKTHESRLFAESCVPNKGGTGHHDDKSGHPCTPHPASDAASKDPSNVVAQPVGKIDTSKAKLLDTALAHVGGAAAAAKHTASRVGSAVFGTLSPDEKVAVTKAFSVGKWLLHHAETGMRAGKRLVEEAAKERGFTPEQVAKRAKVVGILDTVAAWTVNFPVVTAATGNPALGKASSFLPLASMGWLAWSTAANPMATIRAAKTVMTTKAKPAHESLIREDMDQADMQALAGSLVDVPDESLEWYVALLCAGIDQGMAPSEAIEAANEHVNQQAQESVELSPDELEDWATQLREAAQRKKGEVWQGASGRYFTINDKGRAVPAKAPTGGEKATPKAGKQAAPSVGKKAPAKPAAAKAAKLTPDQANDRIKGMLSAGKTSPQDAADLAAHLLSLTVPQLNELKKQIGLKATGKKADLAKKIAEGALKKAREKPQEPASKPQEKVPPPPPAPEPPKAAAEPERNTVKLDPSLHPAAKKQLKDIATTLAGSKHLSSGQRAYYFNTAQTVLKNMTPAMVERFDRHVTGQAHFAESTDALKAHLLATSTNPRSIEKLSGPGEVGGCYRHNGKDDGAFILDGDAAGGKGRNEQSNAAGIYAHEFAHAIDGPAKELSGSPEWQAAFTAELQGGGLTRYAGTSPSEGFAEFGRALLSGLFRPEKVKRFYPKCYAFWQARHLVESTDSTLMEDASPLVLPEMFSGRIDLDNGAHADLTEGEG